MTTSPLIPGPLPLAEVLDRAFRLYRARFGILVLTAALFLIPYSIIASLVVGDSLTPTYALWFLLIDGPRSTTVPQSLILLTHLAGFLMNGVVALSLVGQVVVALHGESLTVWASIWQALRRLWSYSGMYIMRGLGLVVVGGITLYVVLTITSLMFDFIWRASWSRNPLMSTIIPFVNLLLFVLPWTPLLFLLGRWLVVIPAIVAEEGGPLEALSSSWQLTRGNERRTAFYTLLLGLLYVFTFFVFTISIQLTFTILLASMPLLASTLSGLANGILRILWEPLFAAAAVMLYYDLRARHHGYDLSLRVTQLEAAIPSPQASARPETAPMSSLVQE